MRSLYSLREVYKSPVLVSLSPAQFQLDYIPPSQLKQQTTASSYT